MLVGGVASVTVTAQSLYTELFSEDVALIVAVPADFAVTSPDELTDATLLPETTLHVTLCEAPLGETDADSCFVSPTSKLALV